MSDKMYKQIFSLRLAGFLMFNGFRIKRIHHNLKETDRDAYLFDDTPRIGNRNVRIQKIKAN